MHHHHHSFVESSSDILFFSTNHTPAEGVGAAAYAFHVHLFSLILDVFFYSLLTAIVISIVALRVVQFVKWVWAPRPANPPTSSVSLV